ncbi:GMC oxidoreductase [Laetiporus sulphureus 93-53]|uniref:GMC oxidoreductase n=1 Tax=Laetiporus sulphureus 93-53 TaxID=1314785 RepID=A0A165B8Y4_9APHY|nr:GMC oxidoreductase [Laetiporus sulphureus 93-53]KZT00516.1 GMC oxidoreductase [Laetiporus sulphureus 93-53]
MTTDIFQVSGKAFDYIIVGGGTAGLALVNRLSEDPSVSVLVLEAGNANLDDQVNLLPMQRMAQLNNPKYDWAYKTVPQAHSNNREYVWPRGKGLGGSSAINFLVWNKPAREYLEAFNELGNEGWNWERFEKYSKKSEKFTKPNHDLDVLSFEMEHRGNSGAVEVSFPPVISGVERPFLAAMTKNGVARVLDFSSGYTSGTSATATTVDPKTHFRAYSANMYYQPVSSRNNLTVIVSAHVTRIETKANVDGTVTATAVHFLHGNTSHKALPNREMCLSAGAIASPQILELSGIGDRAVLEKVGVDVKLNLPSVGANVQEHLWSGLIYGRGFDLIQTIANGLHASTEVGKREIDGHEVNTLDPLFFPDEAAKHAALYPEGKGLLNCNTASLTFLPLSAISSEGAKIQDKLAETIVKNIEAKAYPSGLQKQYELQLKHLKQKVPSLEVMLAPGPIALPPTLAVDKKHVTLCFALNNPFSRGTIHIDCKDPLAYPRIDPHVLEESYDLLTMVELVKFVRKLAQTEPLKKEVVPGKKVENDDQIAEWLRGIVDSINHTVGSCSMLPLADGGVVDSKLKVYHTTNIRVVDISVVPLHIGSHTQALAYALAEQAADIIKGQI